MPKIKPNKCINPIKIIDEDPDKYIFLSEIFLQKEIYIKVTKHIYDFNNKLIYEKLQNHDYFNIVPIYGFLTCKDDFKQLKLKLMTDGICNGNDTEKISLLIMKKINTDDINLNKNQLASIFFQIILTSLSLYSNTGIIHTDIKNNNYKVIKTNKEKEMYCINNPKKDSHYHNKKDLLIKLHGVQVIIFDYDNSIIEKDHMKTHLFVRDIINTCKNFFSEYTIIPNDIYLKFDKELDIYESELKIHGTVISGVVKKILKIIMKYIYPEIGDDIIKEIKW
jgi:hypothetical protein